MSYLQLLHLEHVVQHLQPEEHILLEVLHTRYDNICCRFILEEVPSLLQVHLDVLHKQLHYLVLIIRDLHDLLLSLLVIRELLIQYVVRE